MLGLALIVNMIANRLGWLQPKSGDEIHVSIEKLTAAGSLEASDFIELDQVAAKVMPTHIRIYADGRIERDTTSEEFRFATGCPLKASDKELRVAPADAQRVIARARDGGFYHLSDDYRASSVVYDAGISVLRLWIHGQVKRVQDRAGSPPALFGELLDSIRKLSPMDEFAYPWKFSAERKAECEEFHRSGRLP
jgi:hypothetical protein